MKRFRFIIWVLVFFVLLMCIPVSILYGWVLLAKFIGVFVVVLLSVMVRVWLVQVTKQKNRPDKVSITINDRYWLKEHFLAYRTFKSEDKDIFENRLALLLTKMVVTKEGEIADKEWWLRIGASSVFYFFNEPYWDLGNSSSFEIVSPDEVVNNFEIKEDTIKISGDYLLQQNQDAFWIELRK